MKLWLYMLVLFSQIFCWQHFNFCFIHEIMIASIIFPSTFIEDIWRHRIVTWFGDFRAWGNVSVPFKAANLLIIHLNSGASTCGGYHAYFFFFARFLLYKFHTELEKREKVEKMDFLLRKKKWFLIQEQCLIMALLYKCIT